MIIADYCNALWPQCDEKNEIYLPPNLWKLELKKFNFTFLHNSNKTFQCIHTFLKILQISNKIYFDAKFFFTNACFICEIFLENILDDLSRENLITN